ncbi:MAG: hypothetical protein KF761_11085 [Salinibacterium sp.]|nr:hypothetical protein [Salinibacterium sp.]
MKRSIAYWATLVALGLVVASQLILIFARVGRGDDVEPLSLGLGIGIAATGTMALVVFLRSAWTSGRLRDLAGKFPDDLAVVAWLDRTSRERLGRVRNDGSLPPSRISVLSVGQRGMAFWGSASVSPIRISWPEVTDVHEIFVEMNGVGFPGLSLESPVTGRVAFMVGRGGKSAISPAKIDEVRTLLARIQLERGPSGDKDGHPELS